MKKNIMLRLSAVLLVAVLLTTCVISGTWAKYTTADTANDSARVAKWGVTVDVESSAFLTEYAANEDHGAITNTVVATEKVLAPGTAGTLATVEIYGTPEVAVEVAVDLNITLSNWAVDVTNDDTDNPVFYCPLVFAVGSNKVDGATCISEDDLKTKIEALVDAAATKYAVGENFDKDITLTWEWAFSTSDENDVKDTALGDLAVAPTISATIEASVTQID